MSSDINNTHRGIKKSLHDSEYVIERYIEAKEADEFFLWVASSTKTVAKLKSMFPGLQKLTIEDDYLVPAQIDAIQAQISPIKL